MRGLLAIARTGLVDVLLHPLRSGATLLCLVSLLLPFLAGVGVSRGLLEDARESIRSGADLHVSGTRFGRPAPVPLEALETVRAIPGVRDVRPRIVGEIALGRDRIPAVLVGLGAGRLPLDTGALEGRPFRGDGSLELVVGAELARRLHLEVGSRLPPFYRNAAGERVATVVGVFRRDVPAWAANLVFCSLGSAAEIFDQEGLCTELLVTCEPGYLHAVEVAILRLPGLAARDAHGPVLPQVLSRDALEAALPQALRHLDGIFYLHFVIAFAVGIPLLMVVSGVGLAERRREAALLKALGWATDAVLVKGLVESLALSVLGASLAYLGAALWLDAFGGRGIAGIFLPGAEAAPTFPLPFRLGGVPALLSFVVSFAVVGTGTLWSNWRAARAEPAMAMR